MIGPQFITHISANGERWDLLAWNYYGEPTLFGPIVMANPRIPIQPVFDAGWIIIIPVLQKSEVVRPDLPPWKRLQS
jgi:hypothetical protein